MAAHSPGSGGLVLVIDDQPMNVRLLSLLLTTAGYTVALAMSGAEGLLLARSLKPDVVLLDMLMPGMDGFQVLAALRAEDGDDALPVILLTADNERAVMERAFDAGATDFISKPFVSQELLSRVRTHADLRQSRDALRGLDRAADATAQLFARDLRAHFADILVAAERQCALPLGARGLLALVDDIRASVDAGLQSLQASLDEHAARLDPPAGPAGAAGADGIDDQR